jgi:hypothetical protein
VNTCIQVWARWDEPMGSCEASSQSLILAGFLLTASSITRLMQLVIYRVLYTCPAPAQHGWFRPRLAACGMPAPSNSDAASLISQVHSTSLFET